MLLSGGELLVYGKLLLTFGGLIGFGAWQLWALRRLRRHREATRPTKAGPARG